MVTIKNPSLAGERLTTQYGVFVFDSEGLVDVPEELAQKLLTINGFTLVEKPNDPPQENSVTLEGGVVWTKIDGGYIVYNDVIAFTVTGSGVDSEVIPPENVVFTNGTLSLDANIDTANLHILGVTPDSTIKIGEDTYKWSDVDGDTSNGYELELVEEYSDLPNGGKYLATDNGFILTDATGVTFTVLGNTLDVDHISIQNGQLVLSEGIDTTNLHMLGVTPDSTIQIGKDTYKWVLVSNNPKDGLKLEYVVPIETLPGGGKYYSVDNGYVLSDANTQITIAGDTLDIDHISIQNGQLVLGEGIDIANLHILGVTPDSTIKIGEDTYKWSDVDGDTSNGYELEYITPSEPEPPVYTLDGGGNYVELPDGGYKLYDNKGSYSLVSGNFDVDHISIQNGQLVLGEGIDTANLHILGVTPDSTIKIGEDTYKWSDVDGDLSNGYELELVEEYSDLPNGGKYAIVQGKFIVTDGQETFTLIMGTLDIDTVGVKNGKLMILPGVDINSVHVVGVTEGDTIQIGKDIYKWENTDLTTEGYELVLIPQSPWEKTDSSVIYHSPSANYTIFGSAVAFDTVNNVPTNVSVIGGELKFDDDIDVNNLHVIGVEENSTIQIGNNWYKWADLDNNPDTGLELQLLQEEDIDGFVYDFDGKQFTVEGGMNSSVTVDQLNEGVNFNADGKLTFSKDIVSSLDGVHIQGLESGSVINVAGEDYTLLNADNDMANGYELVGGTNDAFNWKWSNRNKPADSQIWRHYTNDTPDIKVQGVSARPNYDQQSATLTLIGTEISSITNSTGTTIQLSGDIEGRLSAGALFTTKNGIVGGDATSYVYLDGILYVMYGSISGISGDFEFTLSNQHLNISSGNLDVDNAVITGDAITTVSISNKNFSVRGNKLVKSAFSKRRAIRL